MPLMMETKEKGLLDRPPRPADSHIMDGLFLQRVVLMGLAISMPGFLVYYHFGAAAVVDGQVVDALLLTQAQTAAFWGILLAHFGYVVSARSVDESVFSINPFSNRWLLAGIGLSMISGGADLVAEALSWFISLPKRGGGWLLAGIGLSIMIRLVPTFIPGAAALFRTADFPVQWWPLILLCFFPSLLTIEADKALRKLTAGTPQTSAHGV